MNYTLGISDKSVVSSSDGIGAVVDVGDGGDNGGSVGGVGGGE